MLNIEKIGSASENCISVSGRVDSTNAPELENKINELMNDRSLVLDLEQLEYISSAGLRVILKLLKKSPNLELRNLSPEVYDIFEMTGFTQMMHVSRAYRQISIEGCEAIGQGANGTVYRIDPDTVVKVYRNKDALPVIEHERDVARKALVLGIPTAISYDVVKVGDSYASMFEMLNAKSFSKLLAEDPSNLENCARRYVDLLKIIHATQVPQGQLPRQKPIALGWVEYLEKALPQETYQKLYALVDAIPECDTMLHGDYHTKNLMLQNGEALLIDMDTLSVGHPIFEMASIYDAYKGYYLASPDGIEKFLGFGAKTAENFYRRALSLYYGTEEEAVLQLREQQAKTMGLIRVMRRCIKRNIEPELVSLCKENLIELAEKMDTLV